MKKSFFEKVREYGMVDTRAYRYVFRDGMVKRCPIKWLGTMAAYDPWEIVYVF